MASGTPSPQVRIPVGDLGFPPPPTNCSYYTTWGKKCSGGVKITRRRKNYPAAEYLSRAGADGPKIWKKNPKVVAQCRKYPNPYLYTLSRTIPYLYTLNRTIPYLITLSRILTCVNTLSRTIPYLNTLSRTIPHLNTLSRTLPFLNTLRKNPNLTQNQFFIGSQ